MAEILFVSKPLSTPWNDSGKNLVRDLALGLSQYQPVVFTPKEADWKLPLGKQESIYGTSRGNFSLPLSDQMRVFKRLAFGQRSDLWHFFFAPNPRSSSAARMLSRVRSMPTVQSLLSAPHPKHKLGPLLFADRNVVLSAHSRNRLLESGIAPERIVQIAPGILPLEMPSVAELQSIKQRFGFEEDARLLVYPGDLEFSYAAERCIRAFAALPFDSQLHLVVAARAKTPRSRDRERQLRDLANSLGVGSRVRWLGEITAIHQLLALAELVLLPAESLYAKMDYPIVLLEAMSLGKATVVNEGTPANELAEQGIAYSVTSTVESLHYAIATLLDDPQKRNDLGIRARDAVRKYYHRNQMAKAYEALYDSML